jgi:biopolymer transport protein ExbD
MSFPASKSLKKTQRGKLGAPVKSFRPQLTSLIDVMTILLIYLLKSFSAEGQIITVSKDLMLPESSSEKRPEATAVITVNNTYILAEGEKLVTVISVLESKNLVIDELAHWLSQRRTVTERISQYSTKTKFEGKVTIQGDKKIRFRLLKKIMYTCGQQGYNNFSLAVLRKEQ